MFRLAWIVACFRQSTSEASGSHPGPSTCLPIKTSRTASIAMRLATSPASAPPMPSENTSTRPCSPRGNLFISCGPSGPSEPLHVLEAVRSSRRKLSSFPRRTRPMSDFACSSISILGIVSVRLRKDYGYVRILSCRSSLVTRYRAQGLIQVSDDVVGVFNAHRNSDQSVGDSQALAHLGRDRRMGHR